MHLGSRPWSFGVACAAYLTFLAVPSRAAPNAGPAFDSSGWTLLGERVVQGKRDRDVLVGRVATKFTHVTVVVEQSDLDLYDMEIVFGNGEKFAPQTRLVFREGSRSRAIDLPGEARHIKSVTFRYGNLPGGGRARILLYGRNPSFDPRGWTLLGDKWIQGARDRDTLLVGRKEGQFKKIVMVVEESDVDLFDVEVTFGNGEKFSPQTRLIFREGTRSRIIDLPGHTRTIRSIAFRYGNLPGGGRARMLVYAR